MANQELEQKHAEDLSVGRYTFKKIREFLIAGVGTVAGAMIGGMTGRGKNADNTMTLAEVHPLLGTIPFVKSKQFTFKQITNGALGAAVGAFGALLVIGYEHWRKEEAQKLAVDEMNQDMANTIAIQPTDKELVGENKRLRGMLEALEEKRAGHSAILAQGPKSHRDHAEHSNAEHSKA